MGLNIKPGVSSAELARQTMVALGKAEPLTQPHNPSGVAPAHMQGNATMEDLVAQGQAALPQLQQALPQVAQAANPMQAIRQGLQNPDTQAKLMAFGQGLSQLGAGQAPNIAANPAYQAMMKRQGEAEQRKQMEGLLEDLPPELRKVVATMPPGVGQKVIYDYMVQKMQPVAPTKGVAVGGKLVNPITGEVMYGGEPGSEMTTAMQSLHQRARAAGLQPGSREYEQFMASNGKLTDMQLEYMASGSPLSFDEWSRDRVALGGGVKLTEQQSKDLVYLTRAEGSEPGITENTEALTSYQERGASNVPFVGNSLVSENFQTADRASKEFLAAILRKDTGAAVTEAEWTLYAPMFIPAPGDKPGNLEDKAEARQRAMDAIRLGLGPAEILLAARGEDVAPQGQMLTNEQLFEEYR